MTFPTILPLLAAAAPAPGVPLTPDADEARSWVVDELRQAAYTTADVNLFARIGATVKGFFDRVLGNADVPMSPLSVIILVAILAAIVALAIWWAGRPRRRGAAAGTRAVFDADSVTDSAGHRRLAERAAAAGDWASAVRERFRAVARELEERTVLDPRPGRTAHEIAAEAGPLLAAVSPALHDGARVFDDVCYGSRPATAEMYAGLTELDRLASRARPDFSAVGGGQAAWAGPS